MARHAQEAGAELLRWHDAAGVAATVSGHVRRVAGGLLAALRGALARLRAAMQLAVTVVAGYWQSAQVAAEPTMRALSASDLRGKRRRAAAAASSGASSAGRWAAARYAALDPDGKLLAAARAATAPPNVVYLLAGLGAAGLATAALLVRATT